jgi:uncharacterized membrane protein YdjX (TVP38/TMEM64 family)
VRKKINEFIDNTGGIRLLLLLAVVAVFPTIFSSSVIYFLRDTFFTGSIGLQDAMLFFLIAIFTMSLALTPTTLVAILTGYFFGWSGFIPLMLAYAVACILGLQTGKFLNHYFVGDRLFQNKKLHRFFEQLHQQEFMLVFFGRLSPVLPFAMMNIAFASIELNLKRYIIASISGALPRTFLFFYVGRSVSEIWDFALNPTLEGSIALIPVVLIAVSTLGLIWVFKSVMPTDNNK